VPSDYTKKSRIVRLIRRNDVHMRTLRHVYGSDRAGVGASAPTNIIKKVFRRNQ